MDVESKNILGKVDLPGIRTIALEQLENKELLKAKADRNLSEYCWTMKPVLVQYLFEKYKFIEIITFLDSDLYFFDNPMKMFLGKRKWNIMVTTHRISRKVNSGFIAFKRSKTTGRAISWWKKKCIEWCYMRFEDEKFGDQGYLDSMREMFSGIRYLEMPGVNIAPWNFFKYDFSTKDGKVYIGRCRLIFFHFSSFKLKKVGFSTIRFDSEIPCEVCSKYCTEARKAIELIKGVDSEIAENSYVGV